MKRLRDFPKEIVIRGATWTIRWRRKLYDADHGWCLGLCHFDDRLIELKLGMKPKERASTFWHEVFHAVSYEHGFRITHPTITNLEGPMAEFFAQNAWIHWAEWFDAKDERA